MQVLSRSKEPPLSCCRCLPAAQTRRYREEPCAFIVVAVPARSRPVAALEWGGTGSDRLRPGHRDGADARDTARDRAGATGRRPARAAGRRSGPGNHSRRPAPPGRRRRPRRARRHGLRGIPARGPRRHRHARPARLAAAVAYRPAVRTVLGRGRGRRPADVPVAGPQQGEHQRPAGGRPLADRQPAPARLARAGQQRRLWELVSEMSDRCRRLLAVIAFAPRPDYATIAVDLGIPVGSIGPTRGRCLAKLRARLDGGDWT